MAPSEDEAGLKRTKQLERKVATLTAINGALQAENERLRVATSHQADADASMSLQEECTRRVTEAEAHVRDHQRVRSTLQARVDALERELRDVTSAREEGRESLRVELEESRRVQASWKHAADAAREQAHEAHRAMAALEDELMGRLRQVEREKEAYEAERREDVQRATEASQPLLEEIQSLHRRTSELREAWQASEASVEVHQARIVQLQEEVRDRDVQLVELRAIHAKLVDEHEACRGREEELQKRNAAQADELASSRARVASLQASLRTSESRLEASAERIARLEGSLRDAHEAQRVAAMRRDAPAPVPSSLVDVDGALLELLGERNERVEQLEEDVRDLKRLLRDQAEAMCCLRDAPARAHVAT